MLAVIYKFGPKAFCHEGKRTKRYFMGKLGKRGINPGGILSTQEVATVLRISHPTLLRMLKEKRIPEPQRVSGVRYWNRTDVRQAMLVLEESKSQKTSRVKRGRE